MDKVGKVRNTRPMPSQVPRNSRQHHTPAKPGPVRIPHSSRIRLDHNQSHHQRSRPGRIRLSQVRKPASSRQTKVRSIRGYPLLRRPMSPTEGNHRAVNSGGATHSTQSENRRTPNLRSPSFRNRNRRSPSARSEPLRNSTSSVRKKMTRTTRTATPPANLSKSDPA